MIKIQRFPILLIPGFNQSSLLKNWQHKSILLSSQPSAFEKDETKTINETMIGVSVIWQQHNSPVSLHRRLLSSVEVHHPFGCKPSTTPTQGLGRIQISSEIYCLGRKSVQSRPLWMPCRMPLRTTIQQPPKSEIEAKKSQEASTAKIQCYRKSIHMPLTTIASRILGKIWSVGGITICCQHAQ